MLKIFPDYYPHFRCIAGECRHNCCIGWEIDIDPDTLAYYDTLPGVLGDRLREGIARAQDTPEGGAPEGEAHFILTQEERCPFLNGDNLCDIITELGQEHLCAICADHPRFRCGLPGRVETGLGLCCEAAAALILGWQEPVRLVTLDESKDGESMCVSVGANVGWADKADCAEGGEAASPDSEDEIIALRDEVIALLQNRVLPVEQRLGDMLALFGVTLTDTAAVDMARELLGLERLDEQWTDVLERFLAQADSIDYAGFGRHMAARQTEYEQLAVYLIYRHMASACDIPGAAARAVLCALVCRLLFCLGAAQWSEVGSFSFAQQVELARLFSSEVEYSDENLYILLERIELGDFGV